MGVSPGFNVCGSKYQTSHTTAQDVISCRRCIVKDCLQIRYAPQIRPLTTTSIQYIQRYFNITLACIIDGSITNLKPKKKRKGKLKELIIHWFLHPLSSLEQEVMHLVSLQRQGSKSSFTATLPQTMEMHAKRQLRYSSEYFPKTSDLYDFKAWKINK